MSSTSLWFCPAVWAAAFVCVVPSSAIAQSEDAGIPAATDAGSEPGATPGDAGAPVSVEDSGGVPVEASASTRDVEPSSDDLEAIRAALGADAVSREESTGGSGTESAAGPTGTSAIQRMLPDISVIADFALAWFTDDAPLQTGEHDPASNGFTLQQIELTLASVVDPYFRFDANIVFRLFEVEVEEAYGTTLDLPAHLQIRAGQFLTRFGRLNATHPHAWDFVDQPLAIGRVFGGDGNRGLGLEVSWLTPLPWYVELVASSTMAGGESTARSFYGDDDQTVETPADLLYVGAIKQFFPLSDDLSLAWGLSAAFGPNGVGTGGRSDVYGTDVYLKYRPISRASDLVLSLQTEWLYRRRGIPGDVLQDVTGYAQVLWRFARRWAMGGRYDYGSPPYGQSGGATADDLDPAWTDHRHRATWALTFWPTEFSRIRLQSSLDIPTWQNDPTFAAFIALELVAGVHGGHVF